MNGILSASYDNLNNKLQNILEENSLTGIFDTSSKTIELRVKPNKVAAEQISITPEDPEKVSSSDSQIRIMFEDGGITINIEGKIFISESLLNKLKNLAKKLNYVYLQMVYDDLKSVEAAGSGM